MTPFEGVDWEPNPDMYDKEGLAMLNKKEWRPLRFPLDQPLTERQDKVALEAAKWRDDEAERRNMAEFGYKQQPGFRIQGCRAEVAVAVALPGRWRKEWMFKHPDVIWHLPRMVGEEDHGVDVKSVHPLRKRGIRLDVMDRDEDARSVFLVVVFGEQDPVLCRIMGWQHAEVVKKTGRHGQIPNENRRRGGKEDFWSIPVSQLITSWP